MIKATLVALALLYSANSFAQTTASRDLAVEYLKLSRYEEVINASIEEYKQQLVDPKASPEAKEKFAAFLESSMGWAAVREPLTDIVLKTYTRDELKASIAFMKSPAGASATAKSGAFATSFSALLSDKLKATISKYQNDKAANDAQTGAPADSPSPAAPARP